MNQQQLMIKDMPKAEKRTICWFSSGAASAVATKIAIEDFKDRPLEIVTTYLKKEHSDNARFIADCEKWFRKAIIVTSRPDYDSDPNVVYLRSGFLVSPKGASCTRILKREVREKYQRPNDRHVLGFTYDEQDRYDRFIDANNIDCDAPLIRHKMTKKDCLGLLSSSGIEIPAMYKLGYKNNNCIGCVKGGMGYWNKIRVDFPDAFEEMCQIEEKLKRTVLRVPVEVVVKNGKKHVKKKPLPLRELQPGMGRYEDEGDIECGFVCQTVAFDYGESCDDEDL
jgi:hypothetical protein